jgi:integrase
MPKARKGERVDGAYFVWILSCRDGYWRADGRSNQPDLGRKSLDTRDLEEARRNLIKLDLVMAVRHGRADPAALGAAQPEHLSLEEGRKLYEENISLPKLSGGVRPSSRKRYRAVFDKFIPFAQSRGLNTWNQVTAKTLKMYNQHLEDEGYAYRTQYLELTTLKQTIKWLVDEKRLPPTARIVLTMTKAHGSDTYCWRKEEVLAIIVHCRSKPDLYWLAGVIVALTYTGLRISELINLRWTDIELSDQTKNGKIMLADESTSARVKSGATPRTLKGGQGRWLPINPELRAVLDGLKRHQDGYVFHGPLGGRLKADTVRKSLIRDVLAALAHQFPTSENEIGFKDGRLHSFRHFFATLCANEGISQRIVMTWLGHTDSKMVAHYYHLHDTESDREMGRLNLFENTDGANPAGK